jgi:hypothetical protein
MRLRHLTSLRRTEPRDVVQSAGGLWFVDVLEQIDERLRGAPPNVRATFAVWCAEQALAASRAGLPEVHAAREYWRSALAQVWDALESTRDHPIGDLAAAVDRVNQGGSGPEWDSLDEDGVAACIYAVQSFVASDPTAPRWAAQRAVDAAFTVDVQSRHSGDLAEEALRSPVQQLLRAMDGTLELLVATGAPPDVVSQLRASR